jgi:hypothetical protein
MSTTKSSRKSPSMRWLYDWRNGIAAIKLPDSYEPGQYRHRDFLMAQHLNRVDKFNPLEALLQDQYVEAALSKHYQKLLDVNSEDVAREILKDFIADACWICSPRINAQITSRSVPRSSRVTELKNLSKSTLTLAKQLEALMSASALALEYLQARMDSGNQSGFIAHRPSGWATAKLSKKSSLPLLLRCFADDVLEEAGSIQSAIAAQRQTGGKLSRHHFAIDSLCTTSKRLSTAKQPTPLYGLVSLVIGALMSTPRPSVDTMRKRYKMSKKQKTQP